MNTKQVTLTLWVPGWARWAGQTRRGDWLIFDERPSPVQGEWRPNGYYWEVLANGFEDNRHWRDTLRRV